MTEPLLLSVVNFCSLFIVQAGKCLFNLQDLGDCTNYPYGFLISGGDKYIRPCIFLKFNKIWDWKPKARDDTKMPAVLSIGKAGGPDL
jgi:hypothetical protein